MSEVDCQVSEKGALLKDTFERIFTLTNMSVKKGWYPRVGCRN